MAELKITKIDGARRQLETAIRLYFHEGDPASIHTLAAAANQLLRDLKYVRDETWERAAKPLEPTMRANPSRSEFFRGWIDVMYSVEVTSEQPRKDD